MEIRFLVKNKRQGRCAGSDLLVREMPEAEGSKSSSTSHDALTDTEPCHEWKPLSLLLPVLARWFIYERTSRRRQHILTAD